MKRTRSYRLAAAVLALLAGQAAADTVAWHDAKRVADIDFGIFCNRPAKTQSSDSDTIKGSVERYAGNPDLWARTQTVPAVDGLLFGVLGREEPASPTEVTIVVNHPPLGVDRVSQESWQTEMHRTHQTFHGYYLGLSDGSPVGHWTITAIRGGKPLCKIDFEVVKATAKDKAAYRNCAEKLAS